MERIISRENGLMGTLSQALVIVGVAFAMVVIAYGMESVVPGVHDAFHDFRHTIGMPCH
ncbi:MAG TPA: cobalt transporter subunit CbtB [Deltaproteobacteria bacterium]|nr:cobalt transporter subunit CbtB [Deltaproteobacteria bacterium]